MHSVQYTMHRLQCTVQYALPREQGHPSPDSQFTEHCTLHITQCTVHTGHPSPAPQCTAAHYSTLATKYKTSNCAASISTGNSITKSTVYHSLRKFYRTLETAAQAGAGWYKVQAAERGRESGSWEQQQLQVAAAFCLSCCCCCSTPQLQPDPYFKL